MAHIYLQFDFSGDEEKAQLARHKLETWKQAFRLDKKLLYKFERSGETAAEEGKSTKSESGKGKGKSGAKSGGEKKTAEPNGDVQLLVRLGFSSHEKITEHRWVERIPTEEPFVSASPVTIKTDSAKFDEFEKRFEDLE